MGGCCPNRDTPVLPSFKERIDYRNVRTREPIQSIGRHKKTDQIRAAYDTRFYQNPDYDCLWLI
jgi:hypothetical protein